MEMWHHQISFEDSTDQRIQLVRFINFYGTVKLYKVLNNDISYEILTGYLINLAVNNPEVSYIS